MIARIDEEPRRRGIEVPGAVRVVDLERRADEQTAALAGQRFAPVRDDRVDRRFANSQRASTAIAMPIPPPMQSDATP